MLESQRDKYRDKRQFTRYELGRKTEEWSDHVRGCREIKAFMDSFVESPEMVQRTEVNAAILSFIAMLPVPTNKTKQKTSMLNQSSIDSHARTNMSVNCVLMTHTGGGGEIICREYINNRKINLLKKQPFIILMKRTSKQCQ